MTHTILPEMPEGVTVSRVILDFTQEEPENGTPYKVDEVEIRFDVSTNQGDVTRIPISFRWMPWDSSTLNNILGVGLRLLKMKIQGLSELSTDLF